MLMGEEKHELPKYIMNIDIYQGIVPDRSIHRLQRQKLVDLV